LYEWNLLAERHHYEHLFAAITAESGVIERQLLSASSERAVTNILHLFELLLEEVAQSRCDIHELVLRLDHWMVDDTGDDRGLQRLETDRPAVQIMTIHKSKGLEAAIVFLFGGFGSSRADQVRVFHQNGERLVHVGAMDDTAKQAANAENLGEDQRLCYVALTRAKARLYLPFVDKAALARGSGTYSRINQRLDPSLGLSRPALFSVERVEQAAARSRQQAGSGSWQLPASAGADTPPAPLTADERRQRSGYVVTSYSRMAKHASPTAEATTTVLDTDGGTSGDLAARFDDEQHQPALVTSEDELPPGRLTGIFLHAVLEYMPLASIADHTNFGDWADDERVAAVFDRTALEHDRNPRHLAHARRLVYDALTVPIVGPRGETIPSVASCERIMREVEFTYPVSSGSRTSYVRGYIDVVLEHSGRLYVLDWKSDAMANYDPVRIAAHVERDYSLQASLYAIAAVRMAAIDSEQDYDQRFGGLLYTFMRGAHTHAMRPSYDKLLQFESELAGSESMKL
jgi:exodeoxyribonuclease V beta subunit